MLWNIIRDFIVQYITGGFTSEDVGYYGIIGSIYEVNNDDVSYYDTSTQFLKIGDNLEISLGDWLATTITIICMCLIVVFAIWLVRWVFKMVANAFMLRR